jgi:hypothetical protein
MVEYGDRLVVCGVFDSIDAVPAKGVASWNGSSWSPMDAGLRYRGYVTGMTVCDGILYAAGQFSLQNAYSTLVRWDGERWQSVSDDHSRIQSIACANGTLFGTDWDAELDVVRWSGHDWASLGSGTNGQVRSLQGIGDQLYVGGRFSRAGGKNSSAIARWDMSEENRFAATLAARSGVPNPFTSSTSIALRLTAPGHVRVTVFDTRGRRISVLEDADRAAGSWSVTWGGRTSRGEQAPAGLYFIRVETPGHSETRRVVRIL